MIGILTYYNPINYGAVLQAYALQEAIKKTIKDQDVFVIDYCPQAVKDDYRILNTRSVKGLTLSAYNMIDNLQRRKVFKSFIDKYLNVLPFSDLKKVSKLVLGSDQIWNPNISRGFDPVFFGIIKNCSFDYIGSYAASIGVSELKDEQYGQLLQNLRNVQYLSVREKGAAEIIHKCGVKNHISIDLDPTLLLDDLEWESIVGKYEIQEPFVVKYSLSGYTETDDIAYAVGKQYNAQVISINLKNKKPSLKINQNELKAVSPENFLYLIKNSKAVVTDSFHGTVFSLIFQKEIYTIPNKTKGSRMIELLDNVGLHSRIIRSLSDYPKEESIDYEYVKEIIENKRKKSLSSLRYCLGYNE